MFQNTIVLDLVHWVSSPWKVMSGYSVPDEEVHDHSNGKTHDQNCETETVRIRCTKTAVALQPANVFI